MIQNNKITIEETKRRMLIISIVLGIIGIYMVLNADKKTGIAILIGGTAAIIYTARVAYLANSQKKRD